ncbi:MAG TPA: PspC domain-containing protein [Mycobacteriales bacterium]|nr:PspC domain-containing protein [Mycobacteriales bacterium]
MTTAEMPAATERRLTRARNGRVIAGVCQGAAQYFDIDPVIFRIVLAVLTVFGGAGLLIYVLAWAFVPEEGSPQTRLERWMSSGRRDLRGIALLTVIAVCVVGLLSNTDIFAHRFGAAAVAVLAALLLTEVVGRRHGHGLFPSRTPSADPVIYGPPASPAAGSTQSYPTVVTPPARPRERAWLGWLTFSAVLLAGGVLWLVASSDAAHPQPADALAVCVAIAGAGLMVGTFAGRARAMIPIGLLLAMALGLANALPRDLTWSAGTRDWAPVSSDIAPSYVLGAGKADLDLTGLDPAMSATIDARIGTGRLIVTVPRGIGVVIDAKVGAGRLYVFGHEQEGTGVKTAVTTAPRPHDGTLTLHLQGGFGDLEVRNEAA